MIRPTLPPTAEELADLAARVRAASPPPPSPAESGRYLADRDAEEVREALKELARRRVEALNLYEPLPIQEAFHRSSARQRVIRGSNRAGKTLSACVEAARALVDKDPYGKYPKADGRAYAVGLDLLHTSQVFYRKFFRAGAFKMIRDEATGLWRAFRPWDPDDAARHREAKPAPPLIPPRYVKSIAWELKSKSIPKMVKLTTGWELTFFSSQAKPPQGSDLDLVLFDEELEDSEWYAEMTARLLDRGGRLIWSATPQAGNDQLLVLSEAAERMRWDPEPLVEEFVVLLDENPHIPKAEKQALAALLDEDQYEVRVGGEFAANRQKVYPDFMQAVHVRGVESVPPEWTRYMSVDPGRQVCAVLFGAVPPPGDQPFDLLLYDELYIKNCSAAVFGQKVAERLAGQSLEASVIDWSMGRQHEIGSGETVEYQYSRALKTNKVRARRTGHGFIWGNTDVAGGIEMVREWLRVREATDCPRLVVRAGTCGNFLEEIKRYRYKKQGRIVTDVPETRGAVHTQACLRYLVGMKPKFVRITSAERGSDAYRAFMEKKKRQREAAGGRVVRLGPGD